MLHPTCAKVSAADLLWRDQRDVKPSLHVVNRDFEDGKCLKQKPCHNCRRFPGLHNSTLLCGALAKIDDLILLPFCMPKSGDHMHR